MTFPTEWKVIKAMFHTSNQVCSLIWFYYIMIMVGFAGLTKIKLLQPTVSQKQTCITLHNCQSPPKNNWLVVPTPLKNMKVSWDDHISNTWKDKKKHVPNRQPVYIYNSRYAITAINSSYTQPAMSEPKQLRKKSTIWGITTGALRLCAQE